MPPGTTSLISVPVAAELRTVSLPAMRAARSRIPCRPKCPGRSGVRFELAAADTSPLSEGAESSGIEFEAADSRMDATKHIGYPVREHGPYGSTQCTMISTTNLDLTGLERTRRN